MCAKSLHLPVISFEFKAHIFPNRHWGEKGGGALGDCGGVIESLTLVIKTKSKIHLEVIKHITVERDKAKTWLFFLLR